MRPSSIHIMIRLLIHRLLTGILSWTGMRSTWDESEMDISNWCTELMTLRQWGNEASLQEFRLWIKAWHENVGIDQWKTPVACGIGMACRRTDWHVSAAAAEDVEAALDRVHWMEICWVKVENQMSFEYENPWKPCRECLWRWNFSLISPVMKCENGCAEVEGLCWSFL